MDREIRERFEELHAKLTQVQACSAAVASNGCPHVTEIREVILRLEIQQDHQTRKLDKILSALHGRDDNGDGGLLGRVRTHEGWIKRANRVIWWALGVMGATAVGVWVKIVWG